MSKLLQVIICAKHLTISLLVSNIGDKGMKAGFQKKKKKDKTTDADL